MNRAAVAVVGRPNVGKSTLFNKLVRQRVAITEDTPGVTRDRLYQEVEWQNRYFTLIDTGGLEIGTDQSMAVEIKKQVEIAIETADLILFVVDGKDGVTGQDEEIAQMLRVSKKPVLLVVNKIDSHKTPTDVYEFYTLGFEPLHIVSAEQGFGLGDLLDAIFCEIPAEADTGLQEDIVRIAFIGKPNVGKSSIVNRLLGEERMIVTDIAGTTRDSIDSKVWYEDEPYILIDTAGLRRKRYIDEKLERYSVIRTLRSVDRSDICVIMIDAKEGVTEQDSKIAGYAHDQGKGMIILVNKWDLIEKDTQTARKFEKEIREELPFLSYAPILFVSVQTGQRIQRLFPLIQSVYNNYQMRISTGVLNEIVNDAILYNPPPTDKGERLKIYYMTQAGVAPPTFVLFVNKVDLMHFSYLRYLENQVRNRFGFEGVPLRMEVRAKGS